MDPLYYSYYNPGVALLFSTWPSKIGLIPHAKKLINWCVWEAGGDYFQRPNISMSK